MLSQILLLGGVRSGCRCVVFEQCLGLLTAAIMDRLGGEGACVHIHRGLIAQAIPCIQSMDFDAKVHTSTGQQILSFMKFLRDKNGSGSWSEASG